MNKKKELLDCYRSIAKFIRHKNTIEIGFMNRICTLLLSQQQSTTIQLPNCFTTSTIQFLSSIIQKPPKKSLTVQPATQHLALMVVDSILFNLYSRSKSASDRIKLNNSFYNQSMSMSQMSDQWSQHNSVMRDGDELGKMVGRYVEGLAGSQVLFKKLKLFYDRKPPNQHYIENLLETIEYILSKQKLQKPKQTFFQLKTQHFRSFPPYQPMPATTIPTVNSILFTNQLNKLTHLLQSSQTQPQVIFALNRIYLVGRKSQERKHFRHVKFSAQEMWYSLNKLYVEEFKSKLEVGEESKNGLFLMVKAYLQLAFMPTFVRFAEIVGELAKGEWEGMVGFYQGNKDRVERLLGGFVDELPVELIEYLNMLYRLIQRHFGGNATQSSRQLFLGSTQQSRATQPHAPSSLIPVKRLFIYSFLADPQLIKQFIFSNPQQPSHIELSLYQQVCNYLINLFFSSSTKKYATQYTAQQLHTLNTLSVAIQQKLEDRILGCEMEQFDGDGEGHEYFIEEPILNYDYAMIARKLEVLEFTPKDLKVYSIRQQSERRLEDVGDEVDDRGRGWGRRETQSNEVMSPNKGNSQQLLYWDKGNQGKSISNNNLKNRPQSYQPINIYQQQQQQQEQQTDLLTWMTVGGNNNYRLKRQQRFASTLRNKLSVTQQQHQPGSSRQLIQQQNLSSTQQLSITKKRRQTNGLQNRFRTLDRHKVRQIQRLYQQYIVRSGML